MRKTPVPRPVIKGVLQDLIEVCRYWERFGYSISFSGTIRSIVRDMDVMTPARIRHQSELEQFVPSPLFVEKTAQQLWASKGGKARAAALSKSQRHAIARDAARIRWEKKKVRAR
jgi:hypothetical protein